MKPHNYRPRRRAAIVLETMCSLVIIGLVSALMVNAISAHYRVRDQYAWRQAAAWAAAGQLQRYQAGAPLDSAPPPDLWPKQLHLLTTTALGTGDWAGFNRVTVIATVELAPQRTLSEKITGYVRKAGAP